MGNLTPRMFALLMLNLTLGSFGQICMKAGLIKHPIQNGTSLLTTFSNTALAFLQPWVLLGILLYALSVFGWLILISRVRLSVVYPMISISYVLVMALSYFLLDEPVKWGYAVAGLVFIGGGVSFIGLGLGQARSQE